MKVGLVTKLGKRKKQHQRKFAMTTCPKIVASLSFFQFFVSLEQSGSRIPDAESGKSMFSIIVTLHLTKIENRNKRSLIQLSHYCFK